MEMCDSRCLRDDFRGKVEAPNLTEKNVCRWKTVSAFFVSSALLRGKTQVVNRALRQPIDSSNSCHTSLEAHHGRLSIKNHRMPPRNSQRLPPRHSTHLQGRHAHSKSFKDKHLRWLAIPQKMTCFPGGTTVSASSTHTSLDTC